MPDLPRRSRHARPPARRDARVDADRAPGRRPCVPLRLQAHRDADVRAGRASSSAVSARSPTSSRRSSSGSCRGARRPRSGPSGRTDRRHRPGVRAARRCRPGRSRSRSTRSGRCSATTARRRDRYRQFWQFDIEAIGDPGPAVDAEIIELGMRFYADAGVDGRRRCCSIRSATAPAGRHTSRS